MASPHRAFVVPEHVAPINLQTRLISQTKIQPETPVICLNRGRKVLTDMYDGVPVDIPPGHFVTEYAAALHFQRRQVVPGTKNIELGLDAYLSWIAILGTEDGKIAVDPEEKCQPFTDEELQHFGEKVEAIDRSAMTNPADRDVQIKRTTQAIAGSTRFGVGPGAVRPVIDTSAQGSDAAREAAEHVFEPPAESATREAEAEAAGEGVVPVPVRRGGRRPR